MLALAPAMVSALALGRPLGRSLTTTPLLRRMATAPRMGVARAGDYVAVHYSLADAATGDDLAAQLPFDAGDVSLVVDEGGYFGGLHARA